MSKCTSDDLDNAHLLNDEGFGIQNFFFRNDITLNQIRTMLQPTNVCFHTDKFTKL